VVGSTGGGKHWHVFALFGRYVEARSDRVTVVFGTIFKDKSDMVLGTIFMQEFKEGRKASHTAPQVLFSQREPPRELLNTGANVKDNIGYITFGKSTYLFMVVNELIGLQSPIFGTLQVIF